MAGSGSKSDRWQLPEASPVGGWYRTRQGYRGRFGVYLPLMEALRLAELTHEPRNDRMRAI